MVVRKIKLRIVLCMVVLLGACASAPKPLDTTNIKPNEISNRYLGAENEIQDNFRRSNTVRAGFTAAGVSSKNGFIMGGDYQLSDSFSHVNVQITQSIHEALALINKDYSADYNFAEDAEDIKFTDGPYPLSGRFIEKHDEITLLENSQAGSNGVYFIPTDMITTKSNEISNTEINNEND